MDLQLNSISNIPSIGSTGSFATNPIVLIVISFLIIIFYIIFYLANSKADTSNIASSVENVFKSSSSTTSGKGLKIMEVFLWIIFIFLIIVNGVMYFFNYDIIAEIKGIFTGKPEIDITIDREDIPKDTTVPEITYEKQVFHIPENTYTYEDSKALCKAYGGRLATWKEMYDAYEKGADWCSYGWSEDQMALYPTQYDKWQKLQKIKGHEHDCGRPGINGGYISNPNVQFGVNCYGNKPVMTDAEMTLMNNTPEYPLTQKDIELQNRVDYWKEQLPSIEVSPFNNKEWSMSIF